MFYTKQVVLCLWIRLFRNYWNFYNDVFKEATQLPPSCWL